MSTSTTQGGHNKTAKIPSVTTRAADIIRSTYYIHGPWRDRRIFFFAVLYVSYTHFLHLSVTNSGKQSICNWHMTHILLKINPVNNVLFHKWPFYWIWAEYMFFTWSMVWRQHHYLDKHITSYIHHLWKGQQVSIWRANFVKELT